MNQSKQQNKSQLSQNKSEKSEITEQIKYDKQLTQIVVILIAFNIGVQDLSDIAIKFLFKDDFNLQPAEQQSLLGWIQLAWMIKPLWGYISDSFPFFGYRRKSYLIFWNSVQIICWYSLATWIDDSNTAFIFLFLNQTGLAFCGVIGEALIVEVSRLGNETMTDEEKQKLASDNISIFYGVKMFGMFLTSYTGGAALEFIDKRLLFLITASFPCVVLFASFFFPEKRLQSEQEFFSFVQNQIQHNSKSNIDINDDSQPLVGNKNAKVITVFSKSYDQIDQEKSNSQQDLSKLHMSQELLTNSNRPYIEQIDGNKNLKRLYDFVTQPLILYPIGYIFIDGCVPSTKMAMFYFYTNYLNFNADFLGQVRLVNAIAAILGVFIYNKFLTHVDIRYQLFWTTIFASIVGNFNIMLVTGENKKYGIPDKLFALTDSMVLQIIMQINMIPVLVFAARICPKNIEGTMFALLTSIENLSVLVSEQFGAGMTDYYDITESDFTNLWKLILLQNILILCPLPLLRFINFKVAETMADENKQEESNQLIQKGIHSMELQNTQSNNVSLNQKKDQIKID